MTTNYIGIDPGLHGAIAVITDDRFVGVWDLPEGKGYPSPFDTYRLMTTIVRYLEGDIHICVEQTQTRPNQGVIAAHRYGIGYGVLMGVAYSIEPKTMRTVYPKVWQYPLWSKWGGHMTLDDEDTKQKTFDSMQRAWPQPEVQMCLVTEKGKLIDGRSDALGIATWLMGETK